MPASTRSLRRRCIEGTLLLVLLVAPLPASAWQFVNVIDSTGPYFEFTPPGINASGVVAFRAKLDAGGQAIVSGDAADTDEVATTAGPYSVFLTQVSIGDLGTVLFNAELDAGGSGAFVGPNPDADAIATTNDGFVAVGAAAIDGTGDVVVEATLASTGARGIYSGTTALVDDDDAFDFFGRPAINDTGSVAFRAELDDDVTGVYVVPLSGGSVTTIAESDGPFAGFDQKVAINDAGGVVFQATLDSGSGVTGIYTGPNPLTDTVVDTTGPFELLDDPAITENGTVLFWGALAASGGIFSGPDPVADQVIGSFDPLFGSQVANVNMRSEGYSNGRLAFSYTLTDGRSGVAIAYAPEPGSAAGAVAAWIGLRLLRARRPTA